MSRLAPAHRGYEYQDLLVGCRLVDVLLGNVVDVSCDEKLFADDRFDDLTSTDIDGRRERTQFKHTDNDDRPLTLDTFTSDARSLQLDRLFRSMLDDHDGPGRDIANVEFRIVLRDQVPIDPRLTAVLRPIAGDPGPFLPGTRTTRVAFDADALWLQRDARSDDSSFAFLFAADQPMTLDDLRWTCERLIIELGAPRASLDLTDPDVAERVLLTRVRSDVGAEAFPNAGRSAVDVAAAIVSAARAARQGLLVPTTEELLRRTQLRSDFGATARSHPVDPVVEVLRPATVDQLVDIASEAAESGGRLTVVGPPGHGKSWVCQQLLDVLSDKGWLIAEHYCYLGDADGERLERVLAEAVFGSLIGRLADDDPRLVHDQRPRYAADEDALVACLRRSRELEPSRRVALVVDGIDHITRVRSRTTSHFDPSLTMAEALAGLDLPPGTVVIVLSQPGTHLGPLREAGAATVALPGLTQAELHLLAGRLGLVPTNDAVATLGTAPLLEGKGAVASFVAALIERSAGNALYATYLCREATRSLETHPDPAAAVLELPPFDGSLQNYYDHLYRSVGAEAGWVADVIALIDFSVTRAELREMRPDAAHRVDGALDVLAPVLVERATQGGVRIYHESFARYLRLPFLHDPQALGALLGRITDWLAGRGLFVDPRAFRSLLPLLADAGDDAQVLDLVDRDFVTQAVAAGFAVLAINANLATAVGAASRLRSWPAIVRYVELSRAAESYQTERFDSTLVAFADVPAALLGADAVAARLLNDDRLVMPARAGLQMCAAVDVLGAIAPWQPYMAAYLREAEVDNTSYGEASDRAVSLAWLRGRLRLAAASSIADSGADATPAEHDDLSHADEEESDFAAPIDWAELGSWVEELGLRAADVVDAVIDTHGWERLVQLVDSLEHRGRMCLAIAEWLAAHDMEGAGSPRVWATAAVAHGAPTGSMSRLLALGLDPDDLLHDDIASDRERLLELTRRVQEPSVQWENGRVGAWLDACALAARGDPLGLDAAEALLGGDGWYRCWLRCALALSRADSAAPTDAGGIALGALHLLTADLRPFVGDPRSCDLYSLHSVIAQTIERATGMLDDEQWLDGLQVLIEVSRSVTTSMRGELGGPVPPDFVLRIAVAGANPARHGAVQKMIDDEITEGSGRRYYSDLAEYRLLAARLALWADDRDRAQAFWQDACTFLTAYGWHKDITIYEALDPLPTLIAGDPAAARLRLAEAQGLCERVPLHTDLKETRHAWSRWWSLIAKADPVAAVHLAARDLLAECNDPNWLLHEALEDVWREWHHAVDPLVAGALRLALGSPLESDDAKQLQRLLSDAKVIRTASKALLVWLLSRADERPVSYSYTNGADLIARDDREIAGLNAVAEAADAPSVVALRDSRSTDDTGLAREGPAQSASTEPEEANVSAGFPGGLPGIAKAVRAWRNRPYDTRSSDWTAERFANVIGYRLIGLVDEGRSDDAESALRSLAEGSGLSDRIGILLAIAEGLERHGEPRLAALAYALNWTHTRGHGGWLTFGGETEIESLHRATALDAEIASAVVGEEIERVVATSRYGTYGISQALIHALAVGALACPGDSGLALAFAAWDEAFAVISSRAPRVDDSDDPDHPYVPPSADGGELAPGDLEGAFALAALGGLAHPSRERKRRALVAARLLLENRPAVASTAFAIALRSISDPATLTWVLSLLESCNLESRVVLETCQAELRELVRRDLLTVRSVARRMVSGNAPPLAPSTPANAALAGVDAQGLWVPDVTDYERSDDPPGVDGLLDSVAGQRIRRGERILEGLRDAVRIRAAEALNSDALKKRLDRQLDAFADRVNKRWPDAFLAHEQAIEETLQVVAASGRATMLMSGEPTSDPIAWEDNLASALLDDPTVPLTLEAHRQPRPPLPPPPGSEDEVYVQMRDSARGMPTEIVENAVEQEGLLLATLTLEPVTALLTVDRGPYRGWHWIATVERRSLKHRDWRRDNDLFAKRYRVLEVRDAEDRLALTLPPVAAGDLRLWKAEIDESAGRPPLDSSQPLFGVDNDLQMVGDGRATLGAPPFVIVPTPSLVAVLGLRPGEPCTYEDEDGVGLALVLWRAEYDVSEYYLAWPRTHGAGIVIRSDLLEKLVEIAGSDRLVLRDFLVADSELAAPEGGHSTDRRPPSAGGPDPM